MKSKRNLFVVALHVLVPIVVLLLQGCAGGPCFVDCLNWPYNVPTDEPAKIPEQEYTDSMLLPPVSFPVESDISMPPVAIMPEMPATAPDQFYTVKKGDTLSGIASMYGTTWKELAAYNGLDNPNKLVVGQDLRIQGSRSPAAPVSRPPARSVSPSSVSSSGSSLAGGSVSGSIPQGSSYVIQRGDTLSGISKRSGLSIAELKAANALTSTGIVAGKSLSIPKKGEVSSSAPVSKSAPAPAKAPAPALAPIAGPAPVAEAVADPAPIADIAPLAPAASAPVYEHVLYPGETLEDVASQFGSTKEEIMMLNNLANPDDIKPGTKLLVPIPE
jgi:LysM repeat protein